MSVELEPVRMPIMAPTGDGRLPLAAPREPIIRLADVNAYYGTCLAVRDVSMEIRPNAITAII